MEGRATDDDGSRARAGLSDNAMNVVRREHKVDGSIALYAILEERPGILILSLPILPAGRHPRHRSPS